MIWSRALDGLYDSVLRTSRHNAQSLADSLRGLMMTRVDRDGSSPVIPRFSLWQDKPAQPRSGIHLNRVRDADASSRFVIDRRLDVLQQRSVTIHVENLQTIADAEHRFAQ